MKNETVQRISLTPKAKEGLVNILNNKVGGFTAMQLFPAGSLKEKLVKGATPKEVKVPVKDNPGAMVNVILYSEYTDEAIEINAEEILIARTLIGLIPAWNVDEYALIKEYVEKLGVKLSETANADKTK